MILKCRLVIVLAEGAIIYCSLLSAAVLRDRFEIRTHGKTAYHYLYGKKLIKEVFKFGTKVLYEVGKVKLESKWQESLYMGRHPKEDRHLVYDYINQKLQAVNQVRDATVDKRWDPKLLEGMTVTPWNWTTERINEDKIPAVYTRKVMSTDRSSTCCSTTHVC